MTEKEQRYLDVLMEEMNGKFSLVLEGHAAIRQEMASGFHALGAKVEGHADRIRFLERKVA